jgi:DNA-binding GntR family transcriptional regulator
VDAVRDAIIAVTGLGRNLRAVDEREHIVGALRRRDLTTVQHLRRAHLLRFYENVAPLLAADRPANACQGGFDQ